MGKEPERENNNKHLKFITMKNIIILLAFILGITANTLTQTDTVKNNKYEIGVRFQNFRTSPEFMIKKRLNENTLRRHRIKGSFSGSLLSSSLYGSVAIGKEKEVRLIKNLNFIHGFEYGFSLGTSAYIGETPKVGAGISLGYMIGAKYQLFDKINLGVEVIPGANLNTYYAHKNVSFNISKRALNPQFTLTFNF